MLKSFTKFLNFEALDKSLTPLWEDIFVEKESCNFKMRTDTTKALYHLLLFLQENMPTFNMKNFYDNFVKLEKNIFSMQNKNTEKSLASKGVISQDVTTIWL